MTYRIVTYELARVKTVYHINAGSQQEAETLLFADWPPSIEEDITEYGVGDVQIAQCTPLEGEKESNGDL